MIAGLPLLLTLEAATEAPSRAAVGFPIPHAVDCVHQGAPDIRAVCADRSLIRADAEMATLYDAITNLVAMGGEAISMICNAIS